MAPASTRTRTRRSCSSILDDEPTSKIKKTSSGSKLFSVLNTKPAVPPKPSRSSRSAPKSKPAVAPKPQTRQTKPAVPPKPTNRRRTVAVENVDSNVVKMPKQRSAGRLPKTPGWTSPTEDLFRRPISMPTAHVNNTRRYDNLLNKMNCNILYYSRLS